MEPEVSLPHSQQPTACPHFEPDESFPYLQSYFLNRFYYPPPSYAWIFQVVSLPQVFPPKPCMYISPLSAKSLPTTSQQIT